MCIVAETLSNRRRHSSSRLQRLSVSHVFLLRAINKLFSRCALLTPSATDLKPYGKSICLRTLVSSWFPHLILCSMLCDGEYRSCFSESKLSFLTLVVLPVWWHSYKVPLSSLQPACGGNYKGKRFPAKKITSSFAILLKNSKYTASRRVVALNCEINSTQFLSMVWRCCWWKR